MAHNRIVVIEGFAGGLEALKNLFRQLKSDFPAPVLAVLPLSSHKVSHLNSILIRTNLRVIEPCDDEKLGHARYITRYINRPEIGKHYTSMCLDWHG